MKPKSNCFFLLLCICIIACNKKDDADSETQLYEIQYSIPTSTQKQTFFYDSEKRFLNIVTDYWLGSDTNSKQRMSSLEFQYSNNNLPFVITNKNGSGAVIQTVTLQKEANHKLVKRYNFIGSTSQASEAWLGLDEKGIG